MCVPEDGILQASYPFFPFVGILGLEMERFPVHGDGERAVILVVDADHGPFQTDTASSNAAHHFFF